MKQAREERSISLEELQELTKIQKRYLAAIEEGRFDALPGKFYARAFIKSYAEAVNINPDQLFDEFSNELPNPRKEVTDLPSRSERTKDKSKAKVTTNRSKFRSLIPALVAGICLVAIVFGIWVYLQNNNEGAEGVPSGDQEEPFEEEINVDLNDEPPVDNEDGTEEEPAPEQDINQEEDISDEEEVAEVTTEQQLTHLETQGNHSYYELVGTDQFLVDINYTGTSYVGISNGKGNTFYAANATENDETMSYDFSEEEEIEFNFGASPFVELRVNGEHLEFPIDTVHQKVTVTFNPDVD
ncbi:helix-turn-helix domain-containing protein [Desertibacillus haloalkaliphilus]|nr:helix-turn-helix domain-containing protein [Desertibacillus haloalkaliphilus]